MNAKTLVVLVLLILALAVPASAAPPLPRGSEIRVNTNRNVYSYGPSVAVFPDGSFVVAWTAGAEIHGRFFDKAGKPKSGELRLINQVAGSQSVDQIAADRDGSFLLVWTERVGTATNVFVRRFNRNGTHRGTRIRVNDPSSSERTDGVLAIGPDGRFAVAWKEYVEVAEDELYTNAVARIFSAQGAPLTAEISVRNGDYGIGDDTINTYPTGVALGPDGTLSVLVQSRVTEILETELIRFPGNGAFPTLTRLDPISSCCPAHFHGSSVAMGRDGSLVATWSESPIMAQRFTPQGGERGNRLLVSKSPRNLQVDPAVALQAGGSFVIVWTEEDGRDGDGAGIFGRAFAANGRPLSRDFRVNTTVAGHQSAPAIAAARQGPVVVVWNQVAADGQPDIFARVLSANP